MKKRLIILSVCLMVILTPLLGVTAVDSPRAFAPVQGGFVSTGERVLPYASDRILVKFTDSAYKASRLKVDFVRGAEPVDGLTGISSVDALSREVGVKRISRPYFEPKNKIAAVRLGVDRWFRVDLDAGADIEQVVARFAADPSIEFAKPDYRAFPAVVPGDPMYPDHWGHNNTAQLPGLDWGGTYDHTLSTTVGVPGFDAKAESAWNASQGFGDPSVIIAIIDSGVDIDHPDLNLVAGYDFGDNDTNPDDDSGQAGHGTCCAGVAAAIANNGLGATGAAPGCSVMPCKIANRQGSMYFSAIDAALYWAADNGADVISMSIGAYANVGDLPSTDAALEYAYNAGCILLAATSNDNDNIISYPANHEYVVGVGAASPCDGRKRSSSNSTELNPGVVADPNGYTCDGERWWGSNYGSTTPDAAGAVDILGPTILPTTDIGGSGGYRSGDYEPFFNGTSCATPYVAGVCGLIKSQNPTWTPAQVRDRLVSTAYDVVNVESGSGWDRYSGYGLVDAAAAVGGGGPVAPVADFSGSPISGIEPLTVEFTDLSSGSPTSWSWDFGDGGSSTVQNPTYVYSTAGTYTVTLTAANSVDSDAETKSGYITVDPCVAPTAMFSGAPTSGYAPLAVSFTDGSTGAASWSWTFGDGGTSSQQNPGHTYSAPGVYTVTLEVANSCGSDSYTLTDYITVEEATTQRVYASADIPVSGTVTGSYGNTFTSDDSRETITEVAYTGHPVKTYSYAEHKWSFNVPSNSSGVNFYVEASRTANSEGDDFIFAWSTDNSTYTNLVTVASTTEQVYSAPLPSGTSGTVYIRVVDTNRNWGSTANDAVSVDEMYIEIMGGSGGSAPVAAFAGSPTSGDYPLEVTFVDQSANGPTSWSWDFGDGGTSNVQNPVYTYAAVGSYTVTLTATNEYGTDDEVKVDYITVTEPGQTVFTHVSDIAVTRYERNPVQIFGRATVTIVDAGGQPVSGAVVYGFFNEPNTSTVSGTTGTDGTVLLESAKAKSAADFCFEVTDVVKSGTTYDPGANVVTRSCESGDVFSAAGRPVLTERETPDAFGLSQNYPNPFNPVTMISYSLPVESRVSLQIFNVKGELVTTLLDRTVDAGYHVTEWNAAGMSSGIYFYRLKTPHFTETKKMVLLR